MSMQDSLTCAVRFLRRAAAEQPIGPTHAAVHLALGAASIALGHETGEPAGECEHARVRLAVSLLMPDLAESEAARARLEKQIEAVIEDRDRERANCARLRKEVARLTQARDEAEAVV
jgi:hypothetical protein